MKQDHRGWTDLLLGLGLGVVCTAAILAAVNFVNGWQRIGLWNRAISNRSAAQLEDLMQRQITDAEATIEDSDPYPLNQALASSIMPELYGHYLRYTRYLLESNQVEAFNNLRINTRFVVLDFSGSDLKNLDLTGVNFNGAVLEGTDFAGSNLTDASFFNSQLKGAVLSECDVSRTSFVQADLSNATLNNIRGVDPDFRNAVLVNASLTGIDNLSGALFQSAILAQANLMGSRFPQASFDRADLTLASAVEADFSEARSMNSVVFTGANLAEAGLEPEITRNSWLEHTDGLDQTTARALREVDGVVDPTELLKRVDRRIVDGLRAQIESDPDVPKDQRRGVLLDLLEQYWMQ